MADLRDTHEWALFLGGHWQTRMPEGHGDYPTATRDGFYAPPRAVRIRGTSTDALEWFCPHGEWEGWWWSAPLPNLPKPPAWPDKEG